MKVSPALGGAKFGRLDSVVDGGEGVAVLGIQGLERTTERGDDDAALGPRLVVYHARVACHYELPECRQGGQAGDLADVHD